MFLKEEMFEEEPNMEGRKGGRRFGESGCNDNVKMGSASRVPDVHMCGPVGGIYCGGRVAHVVQMFCDEVEEERLCGRHLSSTSD